MRILFKYFVLRLRANRSAALGRLPGSCINLKQIQFIWFNIEIVKPLTRQAA